MVSHEAFYSNRFLDVARFYQETDATEQVSFVEKVVPLHCNDRILDLACGFGRHALLLAEKGYSVDGLDQSADYIAKAEAERKRLGLTAHFRQGDMRTLEISQEYNVVLSLQSSLAFYSEETNEDVFRRIHRALKPHGVLVFDQSNVFFLAARVMHVEPLTETLADGRIHTRTMSFDAKTCVCSGKSRVESGQEFIEGGWEMRFYTLPELSKLSRAIGFKIIASHGGYDHTQYVVSSPRLITFMEKC